MFLCFPIGFSTTTSPLTLSVGFWRGSMISKSTIRFNSFSNFGFKARGIFLTGVTTGVTLSLISIWYFLKFLFLQNNQKTQTKTVHHLHLQQKCFIRFRLSLVANSRIGTDFESTTRNKISKWSFLYFGVSEHFPSTRILELLHADNFMFTGQRLGSGSNFSKLSKE